MIVCFIRISLQRQAAFPCALLLSFVDHDTLGVKRARFLYRLCLSRIRRVACLDFALIPTTKGAQAESRTSYTLEQACLAKLPGKARDDCRSRAVAE
jgi:hypothetical protein